MTYYMILSQGSFLLGAGLLPVCNIPFSMSELLALPLQNIWLAGQL